MLRDESNRLTHEKAGLAERIKENHEKIKLNNQLPYLVGNIVEVLEMDPEEEEEDGALPGPTSLLVGHGLRCQGLLGLAGGNLESVNVLSWRFRHVLQALWGTRTWQRRASVWC